MSSTTKADTSKSDESKGAGAFASNDGHFRRKDSAFRNWISRKPDAEFPPEKNRYHLYVSLACPWAHRTLIVRELKGLQDIIGVDVVDWYLGPKGWSFTTPDKVPGATPDSLYGYKYLSEIYYKANPDYSGRFTVPVLWDKKNKTIVSNESAEIIRMFYTEFDDLIDEKYRKVELLPAKLLDEVDKLNDWVYNGINNGVYKTGFATTQEAYDENVYTLFKCLGRVEALFKDQYASRPNDKLYLVGDQLSDADIRLYTTIVRFDPVYVQHFKCNIGMIRDSFPYIHKWLRQLYWDMPAFKDTTNFDHIKLHYTKSHRNYNPYGITPAGPVPNIMKKDA